MNALGAFEDELRRFLIFKWLKGVGNDHDLLRHQSNEFAGRLIQFIVVSAVSDKKFDADRSSLANGSLGHFKKRDDAKSRNAAPAGTASHAV